MTLDAIVAAALGLTEAEVSALPDETRFFGPPLEMSSLAGAQMLTGIATELGVDVAGEDLALDSLRSLGHLRAYVSSRGR
jgi:acyl carrier protein